MNQNSIFFIKVVKPLYMAYLLASSTATATATVAPTMGLLPVPVAQEITSKIWLFVLLKTRIYVRLLFRSHSRGRNVDENLSTLLCYSFTSM